MSLNTMARIPVLVRQYGNISLQFTPGQGSQGMPHMHTVERERDAGLECLAVIA
jgi:hypothetical protein